MVNLKELVQKQKDQIVGIRRQLHQIPSLPIRNRKPQPQWQITCSEPGWKSAPALPGTGLSVFFARESPGPR